MKKYIILILICAVTSMLMAKDKPTDYHFKYKKGLYYLVNPNGKKVDCELFTFASKFSDGLAVVEKNLKFGYIDSTGTIVIDYMFYDAGPFINGIAYAARLKGQYGYINKSGSFICQPEFDLAYPFKKEYGSVLKMNPDTLLYGNSRMIKGLIDKSGKLVGNACFSSIDYKEDHFVAVKGDSVFQINQNGERKLKEIAPNGANDSIFFIVEEMPEYPGGESGLRKYIAQNIRYPISAQTQGIQNRVFISFVVDTHGNIVDVVPERPGPPILLQETIRLIELLPKWKPGKQHGKPVNVSYVVPLNYDLQ